MDVDKIIETTFECPDVDCKKVFAVDVYNPKYISKLQSQITKLKAENERLKCCGNCKHVQKWNWGGLFCKFNQLDTQHSQNCTAWQPINK